MSVRPSACVDYAFKCERAVAVGRCTMRDANVLQGSIAPRQQLRGQSAAATLILFNLRRVAADNGLLSNKVCRISFVP